MDEPLDEGAYDDAANLTSDQHFFSLDSLTNLAHHTLLKSNLNSLSNNNEMDGASDVWSHRFAPESHRLVLGNENVVEFMYRWLKSWSPLKSNANDLVFTFLRIFLNN